MTDSAPPIRLVANVRAIDPDSRRGLAGAFCLLFEPLLDANPAGLEVTLLTAPSNHDRFAGWRSDVARIELPADAGDAAIGDAIAGFDVLYCPAAKLEPAAPPIPAVVAIPDLLHLSHPELLPRDLLAQRLRELRPSATRARTVVTFSDFGCAQISEAFHLPEERIRTVEVDCHPVFRKAGDPRVVAELRRRHGLPEDWLLFAADALPQSNHRTLFRALAELHKQDGRAPHLVLAGDRTSGFDLQAEAREAGVADLVHDLGWQPVELMPALYDGACCAVSPTLLPGLGMSLIEAMHRATPLIASRIGAASEITGGCAALVDPLDAGGITRALEQVLADPAAARARAARARGRVESRSNQRAASAFFEVIGTASKLPGPVLLLSAARARPRVFIVTPSLNQASFLRETIDSVLAQDYPEIDYFVADGGSTDGSVEILRSYGDRISWISQPDAGQAAVVADAWRRSDADLLGWINSDDIFLPGAISRAVDHLLARPEAAMVYGRAWHVDESGARLRRYPTVPFDPILLRDECFICQPATLLRSEVFKLIDYPDPRLQFCMDYDLWIRLSHHFGVTHLEEYLACSRIHSDTKTQRDRREVYEEIIEVAQERFGSVSRNWSIGSILHRSRRSTSRFFGFLPERARVRIQAAIARRLERRLIGPLYPDRWAGSANMVEVFPDAERRVRLRAESPYWPDGTGPVVTVEACGQILARADVRSRGPFVLEFRLPDAVAIENGSANVLLRSSATFVPQMAGWAEWDERPISILVRDRPGEHPQMSLRPAG